MESTWRLSFVHVDAKNEVINVVSHWPSMVTQVSKRNSLLHVNSVTSSIVSNGKTRVKQCNTIFSSLPAKMCQSHSFTVRSHWVNKNAFQLDVYWQLQWPPWISVPAGLCPVGLHQGGLCPEGSPSRGAGCCLPPPCEQTDRCKTLPSRAVMNRFYCPPFSDWLERNKEEINCSQHRNC